MRLTPKHIIIVVLTVLFTYLLFHPDRHAKYYAFIPDNKLLSELVENFPRSNLEALKTCDYEQILNNAKAIYNFSELLTKEHDPVDPGGEFMPKDCVPKYSTAVIVCYRNRPKQLHIFLRYMHSFLQRQKITYRIFIADQNNSLPFNRALMLNYGAKVAIDNKFSCLILHDVDLLPLNVANFYACTRLPRHLSSSIDTMRYNLPYHGIVGGVLAIQSEQFQAINGMSNEFYGWGGEDDDLFIRMSAVDLYPIRFSPEISRYSMLLHKRATPSATRYKYLSDSLSRQYIDGLHSLPDTYIVKLKNLYTHIIVN